MASLRPARVAGKRGAGGQTKANIHIQYTHKHICMSGQACAVRVVWMAPPLPFPHRRHGATARSFWCFAPSEAPSVKEGRRGAGPSVTPNPVSRLLLLSTASQVSPVLWVPRHAVDLSGSPGTHGTAAGLGTTHSVTLAGDPRRRHDH